ncbi:MAG: SH3 domain-containing protein [Bacilli bacterium]|nr:SH3 domain-containing protein [Bacilli bacterium]
MCKVNKILFTLFVFLFLTFNVNAETIIKVRVTYSDVNMRSGPGTSYSIVKKVAVNASYNMASQTKIADEGGCSDGWYEVYYNDTDVGYICSSYAVLDSYEIANEVATTECEIDLSGKGFPQSYWTGLCNLKNRFPNWNFVADKTNLDFPTAVSKESVGKMSLIQTPNEGFLSTSSDSYDYLTDTFIVKEGSNWYSANQAVVAYYMDPRNFFDESSIFMFEKLSFDSGYQTVEAIQSVLDGRDINEHAQTIYSAAEEFNVNAIYLASRIRQETGGSYSGYALGGYSVTNDEGVFFEHIYNPYNIGAYTGVGDGLVWAATGTYYLKPWITIPIAIRGGASFISSSYIGQGQDTSYYQKFNTGSYSTASAYSHQYMTNIRGAASEASITYNGYADMDILDNTSFTFVIPVYDNMASSSYELPNIGNPNNHLKNISINDKTINNFSHDNYEYTYYTSSAVNKVKISATTINSSATVQGTGDISLTSDETVATLTVTAQNGLVQKYTIKIIKTDGIDISVKDIVDNMEITVNDNLMTFGVGIDVAKITSLVHSISATAEVTVSNKNQGILVTGDVITIKNGTESLSYNAVIKGDPTGDGNINIQDLLRLQKYILGYVSLEGSYLKACDTNQDGVVNIVDLLRIQKHILGYVTIS